MPDSRPPHPDRKSPQPIPAAPDAPPASPFSVTALHAVAKRLKLEAWLHLGANCFYWIAVLWIVNAIYVFTGFVSPLRVVGMGMDRIVLIIEVNRLIDMFAFGAKDTGPEWWLMMPFVNLAIAGIYFLLGRLAHARRVWAYGVGMTLWAVDGAILALVREWLSFGFHAVVLFCLFVGHVALRRLNALPEQRA